MPRAFAASSTVCRGVPSGPTPTAPKKVLVPVAPAVAPAALPRHHMAATPCIDESCNLEIAHRKLLPCKFCQRPTTHPVNEVC